MEGFEALTYPLTDFNGKFHCLKGKVIIIIKKSNAQHKSHSVFLIKWLLICLILISLDGYEHIYGEKTEMLLTQKK